MAKNRVVNTKFWDDNYIVDLDPIEKLLFLYLLSNPLTNIAGIYEIKIKRIAFDTGIDKDMVSKIFERFIRDGKILYKNDFLVLKNWTKHQTLNDSVKEGIQRIYDETPDNVKLDVLTTWGTDWGVSALLNLTIPNSTKPNLTIPDGETVLINWNSFAKENNLNEAIKLSDKRSRGIKARYQEADFDLEKIYEKIRTSSFLKGDNETGWKVDFDFIFCSANNYLKILEGKYNGKSRNISKTGGVNPLQSKIYTTGN